MERLEQEYHLKAGQTNGTIDLDYCGCLAMCGYAPNVEVNEKDIVNEAKPETICDDIEKCGRGEYASPVLQDIDIDDRLFEL